MSRLQLFIIRFRKEHWTSQMTRTRGPNAWIQIFDVITYRRRIDLPFELVFLGCIYSMTVFSIMMRKLYVASMRLTRSITWKQQHTVVRVTTPKYFAVNKLENTANVNNLKAQSYWIAQNGKI
jgi:hypothetical protein